MSATLCLLRYVCYAMSATLCLLRYVCYAMSATLRPPESSDGGTDHAYTSTNRTRAARPLRPRDRGDFFKDMARA
jgi:hypothetical protein